MAQLSTFEEMADQNDEDLQNMLRAINTKDLAVALKKSSDGMNWAFMVPSLDLLAIRTSRSYLSWVEQTPIYLKKLSEALL